MSVEKQPRSMAVDWTAERDQIDAMIRKVEGRVRGIFKNEDVDETLILLMVSENVMKVTLETVLAHMAKREMNKEGPGFNHHFLEELVLRTAAYGMTAHPVPMQGSLVIAMNLANATQGKIDKGFGFRTEWDFHENEKVEQPTSFEGSYDKDDDE